MLRNERKFEFGAKFAHEKLGANSGRPVGRGEQHTRASFDWWFGREMKRIFAFNIGIHLSILESIHFARAVCCSGGTRSQQDSKSDEPTSRRSMDMANLYLYSGRVLHRSPSFNAKLYYHLHKKERKLFNLASFYICVTSPLLPSISDSLTAHKWSHIHVYSTWMNEPTNGGIWMGLY